MSLLPFYSPRELSYLFFIKLYIHPRTNATKAAEYYASEIPILDLVLSEASKFVICQFDHCALDKTSHCCQGVHSVFDQNE